MRSMFGGSYSSLNNSKGDVGGTGIDEYDRSNVGVYQTTTHPSNEGDGNLRNLRNFNVLDSVKRFFNNSKGFRSARLKSSQSVYVLPYIQEDSVSHNTSNSSNGGRASRPSLSRSIPSSSSRDKTKRMPASISMEEAALLGCNPSESMDEVELKNVQLTFAPTRSLTRVPGAIEDKVDTKFGSIVVAIQGDRSKPPIVTYHDLGLNYVSNFQAFFNFADMRILLQNFCVYHINAPGQEENAPTLSETYVYPTMDELGEQVYEVVSHYGHKRVIGFGVGAGANILCRFALAYPEKVECLCVLNCVSTQTGWIEWGYQKLNAMNLRNTGTMTQRVLEYLMWHHFGNTLDERNHDLTHVYRQYFESQVNPVNLSLFIDSYIKRSDLDITRELDPTRKKDVKTIRAPVLNVTAAFSPHVDDTVTFNGRLDPSNSTWMKIQDCGMVLEEQPGKLAEAFRLFLQGQGYVLKLFRKNSLPEVPCLSTQKTFANRKLSVDSGTSVAGGCSSGGGSSGSLNGSSVVTKTSQQVTSGFNATSQFNTNVNPPNPNPALAGAAPPPKHSPGSSDSGLNEMTDSSNPNEIATAKSIHITENPIPSVSRDTSTQQYDQQNNPTC